MGGLAIVMFAGITGLAIASDVHMAEDPAHLIGLPAGEEQKTALSQIALATFGSGILFYLVQGFTAAILILAANTAFNGFPVLSSLLGRDNYLPHQLSNRGDRSSSRTGSSLLAGVAILLIVAFDASVTRLIQLYILGVFLSFTLSQTGMVRHWAALIADAGPAERRPLRRKQALNGLGAAATALVFVVVLVTKFAAGAWIVVVAAPILFMAMKSVSRHYGQLEERLTPGRCRPSPPRAASTPWSWSRTCSRRPCRRWRSRRRATPRACGPSTSPSSTATTRSRRSGGSAGSRFRWS